MANRWGNNGNSDRPYFFLEFQKIKRLYFGGGTTKLLQMVTAAMKLKDSCSLEEKL